MVNHQPAERYLPALLELEEAGVVPIRARLCDRFDASHPTVNTNVRRLARAGYLRAEEGRVLELTADGRMLATILLRNIRVGVRFFEALGIDDARVHTDAEQWALIMSDDVAEALADLLDGNGSVAFDHARDGSSSLDYRSGVSSVASER
jgi:DtxR family Mn-dependent transcriptional regulator